MGPALEEFIFNDAEPHSRRSLTYPTASLDPSEATLTVRANQRAPRETPADLRWRFVSPTEIEISRPAGFDGGAIYELVYQAKDPIVMGLGFAAIRDAISFLRYQETDPTGTDNPLAFEGLPGVAISLGISQSGRVLRDFLYQGFNEDLSGQIVFDGMHPNIAGSRKSFTNYQFAQPGRWQKQHEDHSYPGDQFPFTYTTLSDPISGRTDGLQERCTVSNTCPKIVHSDGEAELWQARSSLVVTDPRGHDIELPENVRVYLIAGTQHGGGRGVHATTPTRGFCQNLNNPLALGHTRLALSVALYEWVVDGTAPPPSRFPTVANGGLVTATAVRFPDVPGVTYSGSYNPLHLYDHRSIPPTQGAPYTVLVARTDSDGNMVDGVRHPNLAAPIGTYTGWNLRRQGFAEGAQCGGTGFVRPVRGQPDRASVDGRPAPVDGGTLPHPSGLPPRGLRCRGRPRAGSVAAQRRRRRDYRARASQPPQDVVKVPRRSENGDAGAGYDHFGDIYAIWIDTAASTRATLSFWVDTHATAAGPVVDRGREERHR